jgi:membrane protein required for colicin V production
MKTEGCLLGGFTDAAIAVILILYAVSGFRRGFIRALVDLLGGIVALVAAILFAKSFAAWALGFFGPSLPKWAADPVISKILAIVILFILFECLIQTIASILSKIARLPGLRQLNALLGGVLGFGKGSVVVLLLCAMLRISLPTAAASTQQNQTLRQFALSQIYQTVSENNPVYNLIQSQIWNEVGIYGKKAV